MNLFTIFSFITFFLIPVISSIGNPSPPPFDSKLYHFNQYAVCADDTQCSKVGSDTFEKGGNVVDSAIATQFCNGIVVGQSMGIGGGFIMNIYKDKKFYTLNAKEVAPFAARKNMFKFETPHEYELGPLAIGVPGEIKGYWELHKRFGSMPWKSLVEPAIKLCEQGFTMSQHMFESLETCRRSPFSKSLYEDEYLRKTFYKGINSTYQAGDIVKCAPELCNTYKLIAKNGGDDFYNGTLADLILADLKDIGSIIRKKDLQSYTPRWEKTLSMPMINGNILHVPPSAGGPLVAFILNILRGYNMTAESIQSENELIHTFHRLIESTKFAFGYRTQLKESGTPSPLVQKMLTPRFGDEIRLKIDEHKTWTDPKHYGGNFMTVNDKGTSHTSILAPNGDAISVTSSINNYFGVEKSGKRTGIIFNTGVNDFAVQNMENGENTHPSPNNCVAPQKRATSSFSPTIVTDAKGDVRLVIGASGGAKIIPGISMIIARTLWFNQNLKEAIDAPRVFHQLLPTQAHYQFDNMKKLIATLESFGHKMERFYGRGAVVRAIEKNQTGIFANADWRKPSESVGV